MGLFRRSAAPASTGRVEPRLTAPETRGVAFDPGAPGWGGLAALSGMGGAVTAPAAETLATVTACVGAVASGIAALPARVYRNAGDGRTELEAGSMVRLIRAPNPHQTWPDLAEWVVASMMLRGNALASIERDGAGRPIGLHPIQWDGVAVDQLGNGRLRYHANGATYLEGEVLHVRDRSDDGRVGVSRLRRAGETVQNALSLQDYSAANWRNSATPRIVVSLPNSTTADGVRRARAEFDQSHSGSFNAGKPFISSIGTTVTALSVSPEDAEVLASRKFSVTEICRLFNVPPPIVQDYSNNTFTNAAQASLWFATNTLAPIARKIEAEFSRSVFSDATCHLEIDLSGLLRGDYNSRWTTNVAAVNGGLLTPNEVRAEEGWPAIEGGDTLRLLPTSAK